MGTNVLGLIPNLYRGKIKKINKEYIRIREIYENMIYNIIIIVVFIIYILINIDYKLNKSITNNSSLEFIWTFIPILLLISISLPSLKKIEEEIPLMTIEIKGNQWYWTYNIKEIKYKYDSYYKESSNNLNFLLVDKPLYLPSNLPIRFLITSEDVIHSFTIPNLGIKIDSNPGRINSIITNILYPGDYYGQCSELCGTMHSKMPICLKVRSKEEYIKWIIERKIKKELYKNYYNLIC